MIGQTRDASENHIDNKLLAALFTLDEVAARTGWDNVADIVRSVTRERNPMVPVKFSVWRFDTTVETSPSMVPKNRLPFGNRMATICSFPFCTFRNTLQEPLFSIFDVVPTRDFLVAQWVFGSPFSLVCDYFVCVTTIYLAPINPLPFWILVPSFAGKIDFPFTIVPSPLFSFIALTPALKSSAVLLWIPESPSPHSFMSDPTLPALTTFLTLILAGALLTWFGHHAERLYS